MGHLQSYGAEPEIEEENLNTILETLYLLEFDCTKLTKCQREDKSNLKPETSNKHFQLMPQLDKSCLDVHDVLHEQGQQEGVHHGQDGPSGQPHLQRPPCQVLRRGQVQPAEDHHQEEVRTSPHPADSTFILNCGL